MFGIYFLGEKGDGKTTLKPLHYKNTVFHRIVAKFIIQGGDFSEGNSYFSTKKPEGLCCLNIMGYCITVCFHEALFS